MSSPPDIESISSPAVSSLRSRFEQLAVGTSGASLQRPASSHGFLTPDLPPRPRATSGASGFHSADPFTSNQLKTSSSSSDLKGTKRPPPPPPPGLRGSPKLPSPSASPLLRPSYVSTYSSSSTSLSSTTHLNSTIKQSTSPSKKPPPPPPTLHPDFERNVAAHKVSGGASVSRVSPNSAFNVPQGRPFANSTDSFLHAKDSDELQDSPDDAYDTDIDSLSASLPSSAPLHRIAPPFVHNREFSIDSQDSSSSVSSKYDSTRIIASPRIAPPRPPPRPKTTISINFPINGLSHTKSPPPLPARRATAITVDDSPSLRRASARNPSISEFSMSDSSQSLSSSLSPSTPQAAERKAFGFLLPPPKRQIGLGDELPELKRQYASDSSEEEEEEETKARADLPDTSRSSRRPPYIACHAYPEHNINIQAFHGTYAVAGHVVVIGTGHNIKIYDLSVSDSPIWSIDTKDIAPDHRSRKVTSLEFRLAYDEQDRGHLIWVGTKEGHLFEVDVRTATLVGAKMAAHAQAISHIFRYGASMVTVDTNGKVLIFSPDSDQEDIVLSRTQPKVTRIADKQTFIKLIGGLLWTSARETQGGSGASRGPTVRVYDVFSPGGAGKALLPLEPVGTVTCGTVLPSTPDLVYLGHEGGNVTVWFLNSFAEGPVCVETIKVSLSDILCLAGVNDRLWSGARTGHIAAYDVTLKPWVMTNCWMAHNSLPVSAILVDPWSIDKLRKLCVISIGRDEKLHFWDGLLAVDWIDQELIKREASYSRYRKLNVLIVSWNIDANKPDTLYGDAENVNFLQDVLTSAGVPDIISFGFQEIVDLESRSTAAKSVLLGGKTKANDGSISQKVSTAYKKWQDQLVLSVRLAMPADVPYTVIHTESLVGLYTCIFAKTSERLAMKDIHINTIKCGMGGKYGNKGAVIGRLVVDDSSLCFINCHLAAGQHQTRQRGRDIVSILEERALFPENSIVEPVAFTNGGDGSMVLDHEIVFFCGDMNYRIEQRREVVITSIRSGDYQALQNHDQLLKEMKFNRGFRLRTFLEGSLRFAPTYKYDPGTDEYDTSQKRRIPAWCDRILWRSLDSSRVKQTQYRRWEANISDHRPISGTFELMVKSINHESRVAAKARVERTRKEYERQLLGAARQFYVQQLLI